jgi:NADH:ubiquinone oxidoreductase subunit 2 (subunit N)
MGFVIKSLVIYDVVFKSSIFSAVFLVIAAAISSYYYVNIISNSFFDKENRDDKFTFFLIPNDSLSFYMLICFNLIVFLNIFMIFSLDFFYSFFYYISLNDIY